MKKKNNRSCQLLNLVSQIKIIGMLVILNTVSCTSSVLGLNNPQILHAAVEITLIVNTNVGQFLKLKDSVIFNLYMYVYVLFLLTTRWG